MVLTRSGLLKRDKSGFDGYYFGSLNIRKKGTRKIQPILPLLPSKKADHFFKMQCDSFPFQAGNGDIPAFLNLYLSPATGQVFITAHRSGVYHRSGVRGIS